MDYSKIVEPLLGWYAQNARTLPWRDHPTPYRVWISEIMLQQTRVGTVKPYFERFLREVPDVYALAELPEERLLKLWEGLGYYSRARSLKKAAAVLVERYGGELPASVEELKKLPGIGDYTAGAVASIAFGLPEPAVDGNVLRVAARLTDSHRNISDSAWKREVRENLRKIYPKENAGAFTQSLMELGATVCLPNGGPVCGVCPLASLCQGFRAGTAPLLPVRSAKTKRKTENRTVFLILCGTAVAVRKRPENGLLAGMWEFPGAEESLSPEKAKAVLKGWGLSPKSLQPLPAAKHVFSHVEWHMTGYLARVPQTSPGFVWPKIRDLPEQYAIPSAFRAYRKILDAGKIP
jgi:A/G-specific adenine glycosylase